MNPVPDRPDEHYGPEPEWIECPECRGDGEVLYIDGNDDCFFPCKTCKGDGRILNPAMSDYEQSCALYNRNRY